MNKSYIYSTLFLLTLFLFSVSCKDTEDNGIPVISIISPLDNTEIIAGKIVEVEISAMDPNGQIETVILNIDDKERAVFNSLPYTYAWNTKIEKTGIHIISAICIDNDDNSSTVSIEVDIIKGN